MKIVQGKIFGPMLCAVLLLTQGCTDREMQRAEDRTEEAARKTGRVLDRATLVAAIKTKLAADVRLSTLRTIDVDVAGTQVTLNGSVPTAGDKRLAEQVAKSVEGVQTVVNNLTLTYPE